MGMENQMGLNANVWIIDLDNSNVTFRKLIRNKNNMELLSDAMSEYIAINSRVIAATTLLVAPFIMRL